MLYTEIIVFLSDKGNNHINKLCGQSTEFLNIIADDTKSNHFALNG
jgi:hypothetical protein